MPHFVHGLLSFLGAAALAALSARAQSGLTATFYAGQDFSGPPLLTRTDAAINFDWDYRSPAPGIPQENFCVRWTGVLRAPQTGTYTFEITTDDGMRVWLGGKQLFNEWRPQSPTAFSRTITLVAGEVYPLRVDYYQLSYQAQAQLRWRLPDGKQSSMFGLLKRKPAPVPASVLFVHDPTPPRPPKPAPAPMIETRPMTPVAAAAAPAPVLRPVVVQPVAKPKPAPKPAPKRRLVAVNRPRPTAPRPAAPAPAAKKSIPQKADAATRKPPVRRAAPERRVPPPSAIRPAVATATTADLAILPKGSTLEIQDLFFEQSRAKMLPASEPAIEQLADVLRRYSRVALEIAGHTDREGDPVANQLLSEQRAERVRELLIERGIEAARLTAVGYGGTRPIVTRGTPLQRARNRRVEVTVR